MTKLVAIGDSLTQGFQSGAISRTELSFPAMIARSMGLSVPGDFRIPSFSGGGLPLNIEALLVHLGRTLGEDIEFFEWGTLFPLELRNYINSVEDLYERGRENVLVAQSSNKKSFHNLAVWGFRVIDSLTVSSDFCEKIIRESDPFPENDFLGLPSAPMHRTAHKVLNPGNQPLLKNSTQLDILEKIHGEEKVENLILWLGANDCLGTVFSLKLNEMPADFSSDNPQDRRQFNLTHPTIFRRDYKSLVARIKSIVENSTNVFVGTIPRVTIPPITRGIGKLPANSNYYEYYGRFYSQDDSFNPLFSPHLKKSEVEKIDKIIDEYNKIIREEVKAAQDQGMSWHIVDTADILDRLAVKRNHLLDSPEEPLIAYYRSLGIDDHPLTRFEPIPNTLLLETNDSTRTNGGLFSLDSVHPSTVGYGIVAEAFLRKMNEVRVEGANPSHLDWNQIIAQDRLLTSPPALWDDILNLAQSNAIIWDIIFGVLGR